MATVHQENFYDVIIIGAGVEGSATAYYLTSRYTKNVLLLEQFSVPHTRGSSHGASRITRKAYDKQFYVEMMETAFRMWSEIESQSGQRIYHKTGILVFGDKRVDNYIAALRSSHQPHQVLTSTDINKKYQQQLRLPADYKGVMEENGGILEAGTAVAALQTLFVKHGGTFLDNCPVSRLIPTGQGGGVSVITTTGSEFRAGKVILTAGAWTNQLLKPLGLKLPIEVVRVEVLYWPIDDNCAKYYDKDSFPCFMSMTTPRCYGIPAHEKPGCLKVCMHEGTELLHPDNKQGIDHSITTPALSPYIGKHFRGVQTTPAAMEPCTYSTTPDKDPFLDRHPTFPNIIIGAGFSGHGFKLAPVVGMILSELALELPLSYDITPFRINRFERRKSLL